jgi:hypothetical protein
MVLPYNENTLNIFASLDDSNGLGIDEGDEVNNGNDEGKGEFCASLGE